MSAGERARDVPSWLGARIEAVPAPVRFLVEGAVETGGDARALAASARRAEAAAATGGGAHRGAFDLLRADGLATLASLAAVREPDADGALARVVGDLTR